MAKRLAMTETNGEYWARLGIVLGVEGAKPSTRRSRGASRSHWEDQLALQLRGARLDATHRDYLFDLPDTKRELDFFWEWAGFAIEVQGGLNMWRNGKRVLGSHNSEEGIEAGSMKVAKAGDRGIAVYHVTGPMVRNGAALAMIESELKKRDSR